MRTTAAVLATVLWLGWASAAEHIVTSTSSFQVGGDWQLRRNRTSDDVSLYSDSRGIEVFILTQALPERPLKLKSLAEDLVRRAELDHDRTAEHMHVAVARSAPVLSEFGRGWKAEFSGSDTSGRHFRHLQFVLPGRIIALYAESPSASSTAIEAAVQEVVRGMQP